MEINILKGVGFQEKLYIPNDIYFNVRKISGGLARTKKLS